MASAWSLGGMPANSLPQKRRTPQQRRAGNLQEREQGVSQDVLQPWPPGVAIELLECRDDAGRSERALPRIIAGQHVERNGVRRVAGVELNHVIRAMLGNG